VSCSRGGIGDSGEGRRSDRTLVYCEGLVFGWHGKDTGDCVDAKLRGESFGADELLDDISTKIQALC